MYHMRKNEAGEWVEESGREVQPGESVRYHYNKAPAFKETRTVHACIREDKPHYSDNAAIHADQVASFNTKCARGTHYEKGTGRLVSTSSGAREREARRRGMSFN